LTIFAAAPVAEAHTISIGSENAGPSSVSFWIGNYTHANVPGNVPLERSMQLEGILGTLFAPTVMAFDMDTNINTAGKPAGLVDGSTNFYVTGALSQPGQPLSGSIANFLSTCPACGPVTGWQGVTFAGLIPGDYQFTYIPIAFPAADWTPFNDSLNNTLTLTGPVVGTPEPATLLFLSGGLLGLALQRRRA